MNILNPQPYAHAHATCEPTRTNEPTEVIIFAFVGKSEMNFPKEKGNTALIWIPDQRMVASRGHRPGHRPGKKQGMSFATASRACRASPSASNGTNYSGQRTASNLEPQLTTFHLSDTPLHRAVQHNNPQALETLLAFHDRDPDELGSNHTSALFDAAQQARNLPAAVLLRHGATPNFVARNGRTPLMYAARNGDVAMAKLLLLHGAIPSAIDQGAKVPRTAMSQLAIYLHHDDSPSRYARAHVIRAMILAAADHSRPESERFDFRPLPERLASAEARWRGEQRANIMGSSSSTCGVKRARDTGSSVETGGFAVELKDGEDLLDALLKPSVELTTTCRELLRSEVVVSLQLPETDVPEEVTEILERVTPIALAPLLYDFASAENQLWALERLVTLPSMQMQQIAPSIEKILACLARTSPDVRVRLAAEVMVAFRVCLAPPPGCVRALRQRSPNMPRETAAAGSEAASSVLPAGYPS